MIVGQVRSESLTAHSEQAVVVAHACPGHMCRPLLAPLSETGKKRRGEGMRGWVADCLQWQVQGSTSSPAGVGSRWRVNVCDLGQGL